MLAFLLLQECPGMFSPQDLCTCWSLSLGCSFSDILSFYSSNSFRPRLHCYLSQTYYRNHSHLHSNPLVHAAQPLRLPQQRLFLPGTSYHPLDAVFTLGLPPTRTSALPGQGPGPRTVPAIQQTPQQMCVEFMGHSPADAREIKGRAFLI